MEDRVHRSFGEALYNIYSNDQPLFITTDSILHAFHKTFDDILMGIEKAILSPLLDELLRETLGGLHPLAEEFAGEEVIVQAVEDVAFMLEVGRCLLTGSEGSTPQTVQALGWAAQERPGRFVFLGKNRDIDFSQFKPRGHYTKSEGLQRYFRAMLWLGRSDLGFRIGESYREAIAAFALTEAMRRTGTLAKWDLLDQILTRWVGRPDGASPKEIAELAMTRGYPTLQSFLKEHPPSVLMRVISEEPVGEQRIMSSIFFKDPSSPPIEVPRVMRLAGQRFTLDSFVLNHLTFDRIPGGIQRLMASPLDVAATVLANPRAIEALKPELDRYPFQSSLAACADYARSLPESFWEENIYHDWLRSLQILATDTTGEPFPPLMRTRAWSDLKLQTQLASWSQLRHDTVLYVEPSYAMGIECSFPDVYVEPYPLFYRQLRNCALKASEALTVQNGSLPSGKSLDFYRGCLERFAQVMKSLEAVAEKELRGEGLSQDDGAFLQNVVEIKHGSGAPSFTGWYPSLFVNPETCIEWDPTIVDVHTQPTDEWRNHLGAVLHVGVGNVHHGIFIVRGADGKDRAFLGPVFSYYEIITKNYQRLDNQQWKERVRWIGEPGPPRSNPPPPLRPPWSTALWVK
jgi:hypothetical protein